MKGRGLRILPKGRGYHAHVLSRIVGREFLLGDREKAHFRSLMRRLAVFSGVEVVTHCIMDNHFHILLHVPERRDVPYAEVVERLAAIWTKEKLVLFKQRYARMDAEGREEMLREVTDRMYDLPEYMRLLKLRFTRWFNRQHDRKGTLWESRYKSVVVESTARALLTVATYIDLNPVRAGLVSDPKDYPWSGFGEAVAGSRVARTGLRHLVISTDHAQPYVFWQQALKQGVARDRGQAMEWKDVLGLYRCWLYAKGWHRREVPDRGQGRQRHARGFSQRKMEQAFQEEIERTATILATRRVRYLTAGVAIGGDAFLSDLMRAYRSCFGPKRKKAGRRMRGPYGDLQVLRDTGG